MDKVFLYFLLDVLLQLLQQKCCCCSAALLLQTLDLRNVKRNYEKGTVAKCGSETSESLVAAVVRLLRVAVFNLELSTNIREVKQSAEKASTRAFSLLKPTSAFTVKYLRDYT